MLTWRERTCLHFLYDSESKTATLKHKLTIPSDIREGWGVATDGKFLYISDGSHELFTVAATPKGLEIVRKVSVRDQKGVKRRLLNELEYVNGTIFSNVYTTNTILNIDPQTGKVLEEWEMAPSLYRESTQNVPLRHRSGAVLNGIAYDAKEHVFLITGKLWDYVYKYKLE